MQVTWNVFDKNGYKPGLCCYQINGAKDWKLKARILQCTKIFGLKDLHNGNVDADNSTTSIFGLKDKYMNPWITQIQG